MACSGKKDMEAKKMKSARLSALLKSKKKGK